MSIQKKIEKIEKLLKPSSKGRPPFIFVELPGEAGRRQRERLIEEGYDLSEAISVNLPPRVNIETPGENETREAKDVDPMHDYGDAENTETE